MPSSLGHKELGKTYQLNDNNKKKNTTEKNNKFLHLVNKIPRVWVNIHVGFICFMALIAGM